MARIEHCENCGKVIGELEKAYVYEGRVVCHQCNEALRHPTYVTQTKSVSGLGIAALSLGLVACLGCWIPMCGILSLPFAVIGGFFGLIGIILAVTKKKSYVGLPIAGMIVCFTAAFIAILVTGATVASIEEGSRSISEGLEQAEGTFGEVGYADTSVEDQEKLAYADSINIINLHVGKTALDDWGVFGEIKNAGDRTLSKVEITVYYLDKYGATIYEDKFRPVNVSSWSSNSKPLKPNYSEKFGYSCDDAPSEWSKKVEVYITDIEFQQ